MDFLCERKSRRGPINEKGHVNDSDPLLMIH
jgi:hypothetical protein